MPQNKGSDSTSVTVTIVAKSVDSDLEECIRSTKVQTRPPDEIVLVTSSDPTEVETKWPDVKVMKRAGRRSKARNIAWRASKGTIICFWEADSIFNESWLEEVLVAFGNGADAVIDRRRVYRPEGYLAKCWDKQFDIRYANYDPFSAWAFRREVLEVTGGFDEGLEYAEDTDLGLRVKEKGFKILLAEGAIQEHKGEPRGLASIIRRKFMFGYAKSQGFYRRHPRLFPKVKCGSTLAGLIAIIMAPIFIKPLILLLLIGFIFGLVLVKMVMDARGIVPIRYSPGLAIIRLCGVAYYIGAMMGTVKGLARQRGPVKKGKETQA